MTWVGKLWGVFDEPAPMGVRYVTCQCGKHIVHVKREKEPCPYAKKKER